MSLQSTRDKNHGLRCQNGQRCPYNCNPVSKAGSGYRAGSGSIRMTKPEDDISKPNNLGGDEGRSPGNFDYTQWRQEHLGSMAFDEISREAVAYAKEHPYQLKSQKAGG